MCDAAFWAAAASAYSSAALPLFWPAAGGFSVRRRASSAKGTLTFQVVREVYLGDFTVEAEYNLEMVLNNAPRKAGDNNDGRVGFVFSGRVHVDIGIDFPRRSRASPRRHSSGAWNWSIWSRAACSKAELDSKQRFLRLYRARRGRRGQSSVE